MNEYVVRLHIPNTFDLEREVEGELKRRVDRGDETDLDSFLRDLEQIRDDYQQIALGGG